ncbi:MAG TPA: OsmC family protein, partial [Thermoanaerobaculia bacterium]|nr:OsmC family protein [Thermoanaerobaculia bacterium]
YSPYHMLGSSLATCTWSVLASWAQQAGLSTGDLAIEVRWSFVDDPHRVGSITLTFFWESLPEVRRQAAQRAARLCPIHHTLSVPPEITIEVGS